MITGDLLKSIREMRGESQAEFGRHLGYSQAQIGRFETLGVISDPHYQKRLELLLRGLPPVTRKKFQKVAC